jgi:hypothetical protein
VGGVASALLLLSLLFLPWFEVSDSPTRESDDWLCGEGELSCTGFETFPIMRWLLIGAALAPAILAWILIRGHKLTWPPGEMTMVVGFTAFVLILYNGIISTPAPPSGQTFEITKDYGYWIALLAAAMIAATGFFRSAEERGPVQRKAPGTVG